MSTDLVISIGKGGGTLHYFGEEIRFYTYECIGEKQSFTEELADLNIDNSKTIAIIPKKLIKDDFQIIQGVFHYHVFQDSFRKIRNKGLLLAMMILGFNQIERVVEEVGEKYSVDKTYLVVSLTEIGIDRVCREYLFNNILNDTMTIVKNIHNLIKRI